ncbi:MAG TPA: hypothetical protein VFW48_00320 [Solirubrobacterales bacterium]|nr:hypothetical protein [Solirubrobacterales bacterium]
MDQVDEAQHFRVLDTYRHWPWRDRQNGSYDVLQPEPLAVDAGPLSRDLIILNEASEDVPAAGRNGNGNASPSALVNRKELSALLTQYEGEKLLIRPTYRNKGIKFAVLVTSQRGNPDQVEAITTEISGIIDKACRRGSLNEASLYFGQGLETGRYLILARVPYTQYHDVSEHLLVPINKLMGIVATRTFTYGIATVSFVARREILPVEEPDTPLVPEDPMEMLAEEESQTLEVKGSGLTNLDRWIKHGGKHADDERTVVQLARAIVSLLNSAGGVVLLGGLEESKYPKEEDEHGRLGDYADIRLGNYLCLGIDREMKRRGGWDSYVRHLRKKLLKRIGGGSDFWIGPFEKRTVITPDGQTRTLLAIPVGQPDEWFWLDKDAFIVRRGPESKRLKGKEMTDYMRVMGPRGGFQPA